YIHQFMTTRQFQDSLIKNQVVSAQPGIYLNDLKRLTLNIPCLEEQTKIANFLSNTDAIVKKKNKS
ncbi:MAG: restriction endonuclease subunit S, partial [Clostridium sp.]